MSAPLPNQLNLVDPNVAWLPWSASAKQPFDAQWAAHLLRRAAFGASPDVVQKAIHDGFDATVRQLFDGDERASSRLTFLDDIGGQIARTDEPETLRSWWLYAMLNGGHPLREKMVLFWHSHFATSLTKVRSTSLMFRQNQLLRRHALGKFVPLLAEISRDPAMLVWLDANQNVKSHPNENFAREVMELFTLGVANFTESDVREAARAFTGRQVNGDDDGSELNAREHDDGSKTFLKQSGNWDGDDILRIVLEQSACARFLVSKLYRFFVSETEPPQPLLEPLAQQLRTSTYDVEAVVRTILCSRLFFSEHALYQRIKSPVEYVLGAVNAAWPGPIAPIELIGPLELMGQSLFAPPNVKGWVAGKNWLTDATLLARHNFAEKIVGEFPPAPPPVPVLPAVPVLPPLPKVAPPPAKDLPPPKTPVAIVAVGAEPNWTVEVVPATTDSSSTDALWYVRKQKAQTPAAIVRALGEQFFPGDLPDRVRSKLQAFLGKPDAIVPPDRIREAIHAVICLPEYQLC